MTSKHRQEDLTTLGNSTYLIDTHCHLDMNAYGDLDAVLNRSATAGVKRIVTIGIDLKSSKAAVEIARKYPDVHATIGVHPHDVQAITDTTYEELLILYRRNANLIVGYGEIGLDYVKNYSPPERQREHFRRQLDLAAELKLPIVVHNREADQDTLEILHAAKPLQYGGIMHCFSGDYSFAKKILDLGMLISIPGIVTFKNARTLHEVAKSIPLESMVLETDGPFLAPHPFRGKKMSLHCSSIQQIKWQSYATLASIFSLGKRARMQRNSSSFRGNQ